MDLLIYQLLHYLCKNDISSILTSIGFISYYDPSIADRKTLMKIRCSFRRIGRLTYKHFPTEIACHRNSVYDSVYTEFSFVKPLDVFHVDWIEVWDNKTDHYNKRIIDDSIDLVNYDEKLLGWKYLCSSYRSAYNTLKYNKRCMDIKLSFIFSGKGNIFKVYENDPGYGSILFCESIIRCDSKYRNVISVHQMCNLFNNSKFSNE